MQPYTRRINPVKVVTAISEHSADDSAAPFVVEVATVESVSALYVERTLEQRSCTSSFVTPTAPLVGPCVWRTKQDINFLWRFGAYMIRTDLTHLIEVPAADIHSASIMVEVSTVEVAGLQLVADGRPSGALATQLLCIWGFRRTTERR
jgi:hypothetical protein